MHIRNLTLPHLHIDDWQVHPGEVWCVLGENGAGKSLLGAALCGALPEAAAAIHGAPTRVAWVSFETQQALYEADLQADDSDHLGGGDHGVTALQLLQRTGCDVAQARDLAARFGLQDLLDRQYRHLSTGEGRRLLVLQAMAQTAGPQWLLLDEPFEGLDPDARATLQALTAELLRDGRRLIWLVNRQADIAPGVTHLAVLRGGRLVLQGPLQQVQASALYRQLLHFDPDRVPPLPPPPADDVPQPDPLVAMRACAVRYGDITQFAELEWTLRPGQHTLIVGENGCGKSTLLQLISGDHPQCYVNDIQVLGYQRGTGESIWDIKRHIGLVSPALHRDYRVSAPVLQTVVSGLHDSIGLYQQLRPSEARLADQWLQLIGLADAARAPLHSLSYGQQRLVLIARALIKQPPLVILDEPTQGLDDDNRALVLTFIERLADLPRTTLLLVSHRHDEHLPLFQHQLRFVPSERAGERYRIQVTVGRQRGATE